MENVSKALLIAATLLLAMLLIGIFVRVFSAGSSVSESYDRKQQSEQLELYNSKFELYDVQENTIMDLITVANLAYSTNEECEYDSGNSVSITIEAGSQEFSIPNTDIDLKRNQIHAQTNVDGEENISIYKLATLTLDELKIKTGDTYKLSTTQYLSAQNVTLYKYLFECTEIKYDHPNGKVSSMSFEMYEKDYSQVKDETTGQPIYGTVTW